ncbi:formyltransferase family protein [Desulfovibrio ferrophilus]|uniref:Formyl transferase N-terminal domain-containing protein n=1 Tax=Desulfovibrio ferrophilus TaxID=241368 RepID=A0A2Z6B1I5_9BACT|nr:formyltransferase family protein [Desulfovibrio ferrophilus]BBD09318.1 uncharacterized protein DFE_2592 [Desulfovibrio ferrophilus]
MNITVFTSNQPRHMALIESLAEIADTVYAIQECNTLFPGRVKGFFKRSQTMQQYFTRVLEAEHKIFGTHRFGPANVHQMPMSAGDLNMINMEALSPALAADQFIIFGSSWIKAPLIDKLIAKQALNIHMGISPYYRGSSCNFWAPFDGHPEYVGATIHYISKGLDSGDMLYHALPPAEDTDPFELGMLAVRSAHNSLVQHLKAGTMNTIKPVMQNRRREIRYTRNADFTDEVARKYLDELPSPREIGQSLRDRQLNNFVRPFIG